MATRKTRFVTAQLTVPARDLLQRATFTRSLDLYADEVASEEGEAVPIVTRVTQSHVLIAALAMALDSDHAAEHRRLIRRLMTEGDQ
jgi:hypothetical protein